MKILSGGAMRPLLVEAVPLFERAHGVKAEVRFALTSVLAKEIGEGAAFDIALLPRPELDALAASCAIAPGTQTDIARSTVGLAVRQGAPKPDIATVEGFKRAMLDAKSIACSKPVGGGQSGVHIAKVFADLGIADAMQAKAKYGAGGAAGLAGLVVLRGEADIGIQQMAELMAVDGIDVVGPLPAAIQMVTPFVGGIPTNASHAEAGRAVIAFLTRPDAKRVLQAKGLEPA